MKIFAAPAKVITAPYPSAEYFYWEGVPDLKLLKTQDATLKIGTLSEDGESIVPIGHFGNGYVGYTCDTGSSAQQIQGDYYHPEQPSYDIFYLTLGWPAFPFTGLFHFSMSLHTFAVQMHAGITQDLWIEADGVEPVDMRVITAPVKQYQIGKLP